MIRKAYQALNATLSAGHPLLNECLSPPPGPRVSANPLRIAVVKQVTTPALFCASPEASPTELLETAFKHTAMLGLATRFKAQFLIVNTTEDPETQVWKEVFDDPAHRRGLATCEALRHQPLLQGARGHSSYPGLFMQNVEDVDWSLYDLVISVNVSVPTRVVKKFPCTTWAYLIDHPVTPTFRLSEKQGPQFGYDAFLSIRYRRLRLLPRRNGPSVIDWPFNILYYGVFHDALGLRTDASEERKGVFVESHSEKLLTPEQRAGLEKFGPVRFVSPRTIDIVRDLLKSKYYVRLGGRLLWGNAQIEAIAAGCLFLGDPRESVNKGLFTRGGSVRSFPALFAALEKFDTSDALYRAEAEKQRRLLNYLCFDRPLAELLTIRETKNRP